MRMNMDLRDSADDQSQRMLNALEPLAAGCPVRPGMTESGAGIPAMNVEKGQWHRLEALETGTVIVEFKNGPYEPIGPEDVMEG